MADRASHDMQSGAVQSGATQSGAVQSGAVQSVDRAFDLLELIADAGGSATLRDLASASGLPTPTVHRLLRTLSGRGYVRRLADRRYGLGPALIGLGDEAKKLLGAVANATLARLVEQLGETANMAVLDANMVLYVAQAPSRHSMRTFTEVGRRVHAHDTGVGKAILSQLDDETVRGIVARAGMPTPTDKSIGSIDELLVELRAIRERGYSIDDGEQEVGVRCFAIAVPNAPTASAISVSGPVSRVDDAFAERAVPLLQDAARAISADLSAGSDDA
jgi:IclR family transcriptional regulator, acetate operon repressor